MRSCSIRWSVLFVAALVSSTTACTEAVITGPAMTGPAYATYNSTTIDFKVLYPKLSTQVPSLTMKGDTTLQKFTVNPPDGKLIKFGKTSGDVIAIPGNALCDPKLNSYGPTEWRKPCVLAKSSIEFFVRTWTDPAGHRHADFSPAIRFNPSAPVPVRLYFQDTRLVAFTSVFIPYCDALNVCLNEGVGDSELETYVSPLQGGGYWVYRTLRHFSGYTVTAD